MEIKVAERLKELMAEGGLTQTKLASKIGIKQNTISAWLTKKNCRTLQVYGYLPIGSAFPSIS